MAVYAGMLRLSGVVRIDEIVKRTRGGGGRLGRQPSDEANRVVTALVAVQQSGGDGPAGAVHRGERRDHRRHRDRVRRDARQTPYRPAWAPPPRPVRVVLQPSRRRHEQGMREADAVDDRAVGVHGDGLDRCRADVDPGRHRPGR